MGHRNLQKGESENGIASGMYVLFHTSVTAAINLGMQSCIGLEVCASTHPPQLLSHSMVAPFAYSGMYTVLIPLCCPPGVRVAGLSCRQRC